MALSKDREAILTNFFLFKLWPAYPADLCGNARKKGPKGLALKSFIKLAPDDKECERILGNLLAQIRYDRKDPDHSRWPFMTTYLNQRRYDDEITDRGNHEEDPTIVRGRTCCISDCEEEVIGPKFRLCHQHYAMKHDRYKDIRKQKMIDMDLMPNPGESHREYFKRLKEWCLAKPEMRKMIAGKPST